MHGLLRRTFSANEVAAAANIPAKKVSDWADRNLIIDQKSEGGKGRHRVFSWFGVMEVGVAAELMESGRFGPGQAFSVATKVAHMGHGPFGWSGEKNDEPERHPGLPYHHSHGDTWMFVSGEKVTIRLISRREEYYSIIPLDRASFLAINVNKLFITICARLGLTQPYAILDEEYKR